MLPTFRNDSNDPIYIFTFQVVCCRNLISVSCNVVEQITVGEYVNFCGFCSIKKLNISASTDNERASINETSHYRSLTCSRISNAVRFENLQFGEERANLCKWSQGTQVCYFCVTDHPSKNHYSVHTGMCYVTHIIGLSPNY